MLVTVATFSFPHEAHLAKTLLDAMGIPSFVADAHTINTLWLYSNALGGVRLQTPAAFAAEAQAILDDPSGMAILPTPETGFEPEFIPCPYCGGALGERYVAGRRPAFVIWILLGVPFWPIRKARKCAACGKISKA
jgi:hypothetical protein